jgi:3-phenylpropionate/cinnamic acid dioxygenase small subunit
MAISIEDRLEIHELYSRWCVAIDDGDSEGWANTFTDDAVFRLTNLPVRAEGRAELLEMADKVLEHDQGMNRHQCYNILLSEEGDRIAGRADALILELRTGGDARIIKTARYHDTIVRSERGWVFAERVITWDTEHIPVQPEVEGKEHFLADA